MRFSKILLVFALLFNMSAFAEEKDSNPCSADKKKLCAECKGGDKACVKECMKKNEANLSAECKAAKEAKKTAK